MQEPEGLNISSSFDCDLTNRAQYGSDVATGPVYVLFSNSTSVEVSDYESGVLPGLVVEVQDYYNQ